MEGPLQPCRVQMPFMRLDVRQAWRQSCPHRRLGSRWKGERRHHRLQQLAAAVEDGGERHHQAKRAAGDRHAVGPHAVRQAVAQKSPTWSAVAEPTLAARQAKIPLDLRAVRKRRSLESKAVGLIRVGHRRSLDTQGLPSSSPRLGGVRRLSL